MRARFFNNKKIQFFAYNFFKMYKFCKFWHKFVVLEYFENPIDKPLTTKSQVVPLWAIVPDNQFNITYSGDILFEDEESCIYHFMMQRTMKTTNKIQNIEVME